MAISSWHQNVWGVWGEGKERDRIPGTLEAEVQWFRMLVATRPATIGWEFIAGAGVYKGDRTWKEIRRLSRTI